MIKNLEHQRIVFEIKGLGESSKFDLPATEIKNPQRVLRLSNFMVRAYLGLEDKNIAPSDVVDTTGVVIDDPKALKVVDSALVPVYENNGRRIINARELHEFIESGYDFSNWIQDRIKKYGFTEGEDFSRKILKNGRGRPTTEYFLTMDTGKEIAMVENNEKGRMVRRHFIEIEKRYRAQVHTEANNTKAITEASKEPAATSKTFRFLDSEMTVTTKGVEPEAPALPEPPVPELLPRAISGRYPDKRYWTPEEAAEELGLKGYRVLYERLDELGLVTRSKKGVFPVKEHRGYIKFRAFKLPSGCMHNRVVITPWGMDYLESVL